MVSDNVGPARRSVSDSVSGTAATVCAGGMQGLSRLLQHIGGALGACARFQTCLLLTSSGSQSHWACAQTAKIADVGLSRVIQATLATVTQDAHFMRGYALAAV